MDLTAFYRVPGKRPEPKKEGDVNHKARRSSALDVLADARGALEGRYNIMSQAANLSGAAAEGDPRAWKGEVIDDPSEDEMLYDPRDMDDDEESKDNSYQAVINRIMAKQQAKGVSSPCSHAAKNTSEGVGNNSFNHHSSSSGQIGSATSLASVNTSAAAAAAASPFNKLLPVSTASGSDAAGKGGDAGALRAPRAPAGARARRASIDMSQVQSRVGPGGSMSAQGSEPLPVLAPRAPGQGARARRSSVDMSGVMAAAAAAMSTAALSGDDAGGWPGSGTSLGKLPIWLQAAGSEGRAGHSRAQ